MKTDLSTLIPFKFSHITKLKRQMLDHEMKKLELSRMEWQTLAWLNILNTPCTQQELLKGLEVDRAQLARILDRLDKKKIITRVPLLNDRRSLNIDLTNKGEKIMHEVVRIMHEESNIMLRGLSDTQKNILHQLMDKVTNNILLELETLEDS